MIPHRSIGSISPSLAIVIAAVLAAVIGLWLGIMVNRPPEIQILKAYPEPRQIATFDLIDQRGEVFAPANLEGEWDLLFFGFTHCPDICPATLKQLDEVGNLVEENGGTRPRVTLISVDPERDTPEKLASYVHHFNPDFRAATGPHDTLAAFTRDLGVAYFVEQHEPGAVWYNVDHSASVLVVNPDARLVGLFSAPLNLPAMASDLAALQKGL